MTRITSKGQVTIPKQAREALGLRPGNEVEFVVQPGGLLLRKASIRAAVEKWAGHLSKQGTISTTDKLMEELRGPVERW